MPRILIAILFSLLAFPASADRLANTDAIYKEVSALFHAKDYAGLDALADGWRDGSARIDSGSWRLTTFYTTFVSSRYMLGNDVSWGDSTYPIVLEQIDEWIRQRPDSIAAPIIKADLLVSRGWSKRGTGYVYEVSKEGMQDFVKYLHQAHDVLSSSRERGARDPAWHEELLTIYMALGEYAAFEDAADRALQLHTGYYPLYFAIMRASLPHWGGAPGATEAAARRIAAAAAVTGEADTAYARSYWSISRDAPIAEKFFKDWLVDWPRVRAGFEEIVANYPSDWNMNAFAWFACKVGDRETALRLLDRIGTAIEPDMWDYIQHPHYCRQVASQPAPPHAGGRPDQSPLFVVVAFDRDATGGLKNLPETMHPDANAAIAAATSLASEHDGAIAWRLIPSIAGQTVFAPELLFEAGDTLSFDDIMARSRAAAGAPPVQR